MVAAMSQPEISRPSMYAAIRLARLVFSVRARIKARASGRVCPRKPQLSIWPPCWEEQLHNGINQVLRDPHQAHRQYYEGSMKCKQEGVQEERVGTEQYSFPFVLRQCSADASWRLLNELDLKKPSNLSLRNIAADDKLLLSHNILADYNNGNTLPELCHQLGLTTLLIFRLQAAQNSPRDTQRSYEGGASIHDRCPKLVANLEHLLRCLQEATINAIVRLILELIGEDTLYWQEHWKRHRQGEDGWFEEWPDGRHPLSTTWPWNIKPSLLVLWGVCWMFFDNEARIYWEPRDVNQRLDAWSIERPPQAAPAILNFTDPVRSVHTSTYGSNAAGENIRRANRESSATRDLVTPLTPRYGYIGFADDSTTLPYIPSSPLYNHSNAVTFSISEIPGEWPDIQGTQAPDPTDDLDFDLDSFSSSLYESAIFTPAAPIPDALQSSDDGAIQDQYIWPSEPQVFTASQDSESVGLGHSSQTLMPGIPSSPMTARSGCSTETVSPIALKYEPQQPDHSPDETPETSEDILRNSPTSRDDHASEEPPRNVDGKIYCDDIACVQDPPTFQRKCEWTKHRDKHLRPFHCSEPGCIKIQGFTYSGGLLRHQREVHHQHGGPKAPMHCPHQDCKRSSGTGFSRKENLYEHLRRVHRGAGIPSVVGKGNVGVRRKGEVEERNEGRKRRREVKDEIEDEESREGVKMRRVIGDEVGTEELRDEVKRLRSEMHLKDEKLRKLEGKLSQLQEFMNGDIGVFEGYV